MKRHPKPSWFLAISLATIVIIFVGTALVLWIPLSPPEKESLFKTLKNNFGYIFIALLLLFSIAAFVFDAIIHLYLIPLRRLVEETSLIGTSNVTHRIAIEGSEDINRLVSAINKVAKQVEQSKVKVAQQIASARAETEREKDILAAIVAEMPDGVIICNVEGNILLYNKRASALLTPKISDDEVNGSVIPFLGLGRSIYKVIDRNQLDHALEELQNKLIAQAPSVAVGFVVVNTADQLLRLEMVPILDQDDQFSGYILMLSDITQKIDTNLSIDVILESLSKGIRGPLANIRTTIETILKYPDMAPEKLDRFRKIIHDESVLISAVMDKTALDYTGKLHSHWPLARISAEEFLAKITEKAKSGLGLDINTVHYDKKIYVNIDTYSFVLSVLFVLKQIQHIASCSSLACKLYSKSQYVNLDFKWQGSAVKIEQFRQWDHLPMVVGHESLPFTLRSVLGHHHADMWPYARREEPGEAHFRFFLPQSREERAFPRRDIAVLPQSRPEFYDFDLFSFSSLASEQDEWLLTDLSYTVFDTETTGLNPRGGDEIVSIGAVRIVNGRLLQDEQFDQLVYPGRTIPASSTRIHGINPEMVKGKPTIDKVLPVFHQFAEHTILVAHNAAFDMSMLQMKESASGVQFLNPVLDTLLLSAAVHPNQENHNLETIAGLLGVDIMNRHTAMGDAIATARIFLKLMPILHANGIFTLKDAIQASKQTYLSRIKY